MIQEKLALIRALQDKYKTLHLGGSFSLIIRGYDLKRSLEQSDIDFCISEPIDDMSRCIDDNHPSSNDFDFTFDAGICKIEIREDKDQEWDYINYQGHNYKVTKLATVIKYKQDYCDKGYEKHRIDLINMKVLS